jgi:hypothetical protein
VPEKELWMELDAHPNYRISSFGRFQRKEEVVPAGSVGRYSRSKSMKKVGGVDLKQVQNTKSEDALAAGNAKLQVAVRHPNPFNPSTITVRIAEAVLRHFVPNPDRCVAYRHKDGDFRNCRADNLEWVSVTDAPDEFKGKIHIRMIEKVDALTPLVLVFPQRKGLPRIDLARGRIVERKAK